MIALEIAANLFIQLTFTVGFVMLYGGLISLCNRIFYDACGTSSFSVVKLTGYIGTPIHELSHALMCLLFGHTVKKVSLFGDSRRSGTLGYVEHTYYRRNLYHQIGNFFIGISPVLAGGAVILLLLRTLTPDIFFGLRAETASIRSAFSLNDGGIDGFLALLRGIGSLFGHLFAPQNFSDWRWWLCMLPSLCIALHMEVSRSDILSGLRGLSVITLMMLAADVLLGLLFPEALLAVTAACVSAGIFMALLMLIPAVFSFIIGGVALIVILVRESAKSIQNDRAQPVVNHHTTRSNRK